MIDVTERPVWDLTPLYKGRDDRQINVDLNEAARLLDTGENHERAVALLARLHAFATLYDGGRYEETLVRRVNAVAERSKVPDPPEPGEAAGVDAMCTAVSARGSDLWIQMTKPAPKPPPRRWTWFEARRLVTDAARQLSPEAGLAVDNTFREDRVHARHPGSPLCHPAGDRGPFVRLAFDGGMRSVLALAHEMGHAAHQTLSRKLGVLNCEPRPALAETAAAVNEQMTLRLMIDRATPEERAFLMAYRRMNLANIVLRHVTLHRFEKVSRGQPDDAIWMRVTEQTAGLRAARAQKGDSWRGHSILARAPGTAWTYAFARLVAVALLSRRDADLANFGRKWTALLAAGGTVEERAALWPFLIEPAAMAFWNDALDLAMAQAEAKPANWDQSFSLSRPYARR